MTIQSQIRRLIRRADRACTKLTAWHLLNAALALECASGMRWAF